MTEIKHARSQREAELMAEIERLMADNEALRHQAMNIEEDRDLRAEIERLRNESPNDGLSRAATDIIKQLTADVERMTAEIERLNALVTAYREQNSRNEQLQADLDIARRALEGK